MAAALLPAWAQPGTVSGVRGDHLQIRTAGKTLDVAHPIVRIGGRTIPMAYCLPGDHVQVTGHRVDVQPHTVWGGIVADARGEVLLADGSLLEVPQVAPVGDLAISRGAGMLDVISPAASSTRIQVEAPGRPLRAWETLPVTVLARPHQRVAVRAAGICGFLPARETRPGHYSTRILCIPGADVGETRVLARIGSTVLVAPDRIAFSPTAPVITDTWPHGTINAAAATVHARFTSPAAWVVVPTVHLRIDGRDVTRQASVTPDLIDWTPPTLAPGPHHVTLQARDTAGNRSQIHWSFVTDAPSAARR
ncbi:MAG: hypothetical protein ACYCW6_08145 [Candidatus Xenobia bacterium]